MKSSLLRNVYLFKELNDEELKHIEEISGESSFSPGDEIFSEGDEATSIYLIKFGTVKIQRAGKDNAVQVNTLATGSHFGEMAFIDGERRSATVTAVEKTDVITVDFDKLRKILSVEPGVAVKVYKAMAHFLCGRLRITTNDLSFAREKNLRHF